jgi:hypothetical protein
MLKRTLRRLILPIIPKLERVKIIQTVIAKKKAQIYLEIGVDPIAAAPKVLSVLDKTVSTYKKLVMFFLNFRTIIQA